MPDMTRQKNTTKSPMTSTRMTYKSDAIIQSKPVDQWYMLESVIHPKIRSDKHPSSFSDEITIRQ